MERLGYALKILEPLMKMNRFEGRLQRLWALQEDLGILNDTVIVKALAKRRTVC
ncbi:hypothetical protein [Teichococcus deserti]|uniref:hypothetical protein n=1 Tax=Teichococcus deserti TaxID=1817963 RepID=UPI0013F6690B|nr:hypothetical protein [Pseudoroseomonas deserti]